MAKILSGKVKKIPSTEVSDDRYNFIQLSETEPDLGVPSSNGYVLSSDTNGNRQWVELQSSTVTFTTSSTDQVVVETINASTQRSVKFEMQANTSSQFQASELRLLVDLPNIYLTEYGSIGESLGTFQTYYSPASNDYSSPYINNGGLSVWNGTTLTIYTIHNEVIQGLFSMYAGDTFTFNGGAATATLSSVFTEVSTGIYEATTAENRSPPLLLSRIQWTGTGNIELRYTPFNAVTILRYIKTEISV